MKKKQYIFCGLLLIALCLIAFGIVNGDCQRVMSKAVRICLECVGIG